MRRSELSARVFADRRLGKMVEARKGAVSSAVTVIPAMAKTIWALSQPCGASCEGGSPRCRSQACVVAATGDGPTIISQHPNYRIDEGQTHHFRTAINIGAPCRPETKTRGRCPSHTPGRWMTQMKRVLTSLIIWMEQSTPSTRD